MPADLIAQSFTLILTAFDGAETPAALTASTRRVRLVPFFSFLTVQVRDVAGAVQRATTPDLPLSSARYPVIAEPPLPAGAFQPAVTLRSDDFAVTERGAPGTVHGVAAARAGAGPVPATFVAV